MTAFDGSESDENENDDESYNEVQMACSGQFVYILVCMPYFLAVKYKHKL